MKNYGQAGRICKNYPNLYKYTHSIFFDGNMIEGNYTWNQAVEKAKEEGFTDWDEIVEYARDLLSQTASDIQRENHFEYLNSSEWKGKRLKILERDKYICHDCLNTNFSHILKLFSNFFLKDIDYRTKATEVHHLDYRYKQTELEEEFCISVCNVCHRLRHCATEYQKKQLILERERNLIIRLIIVLSKQPEYQEVYQKKNEAYLKKITLKPSEDISKQDKK